MATGAALAIGAGVSAYSAYESSKTASAATDMASMYYDLAAQQIGYGNDMVDRMFGQQFSYTPASAAMVSFSPSDYTLQYGEISSEFLTNFEEMSEEFMQAMKDVADEYGDMAQKMWDDWEATFGDMRENLVDYYSGLDPEKYSTQYKANIERELNKQFEQIDQAMAQTGIYSSGMKQQLIKEQGFQQAEMNAGADLMAEDYVMQRKNQFYAQYGEPARQQAIGMWDMGNQLWNQALQQGYGLNAAAQQAALGADVSEAQMNLNADIAADQMRLQAAIANAQNATQVNLANLSAQQSHNALLQSQYNSALNWYGNSSSSYMNMGNTYLGSASGAGQAAGYGLTNAIGLGIGAIDRIF